MRMWTALVFLVSFAYQSKANNILILAPLGSWSESQIFRALADTLAAVGHHVTLVTGFEPRKESPVTEIFAGSSSLEDKNIFELKMMNIITYLGESQKIVCKKMYENKDILNIWKNRNDFDAIVVPIMLNEFSAPFLINYNGTYIGLITVGIEATQIGFQGNRLPRSVTPHVLLNFDENMNFFERAFNLVFEHIMGCLYEYVMVGQLQTQMEKSFPGMPSFTELMDLYTNYSLLLINSHFAMDGSYPLLPNQVEIGTITARLPQPIPKDLQVFVDGAENGVIYFSLGSVAKSVDIPKSQMAMLIEAFRHLPQRVIWEFEGDHIDDLPSNVITRKWLSQQDILGHPKTLVFISHCGIFGTMEAKYHGVPVLAVPISFDQHRNAARLARKGLGRVLNWKEMTVESIIENINILIDDTSYRERIQTLSKALQDQKESPAERAVWWIEYAIRHKGAPHLQYAGKKLNTIQFHMIDVWTFLISLVILWISLSCWCLQRCCRNLSGGKSKQE